MVELGFDRVGRQGKVSPISHHDPHLVWMENIQTIFLSIWFATTLYLLGRLCSLENLSCFMFFYRGDDFFSQFRRLLSSEKNQAGLQGSELFMVTTFWLACSSRRQETVFALLFDHGTDFELLWPPSTFNTSPGGLTLSYYTRTALNIHWSQHMTNTWPTKSYMGTYPSDQPQSDRRMRFAGHCYRNKDESVSNFVLWTPKHGRRKPGRLPLTYTDFLKMDTGLESTDFKSAMRDRKAWGTIVILGHHST
jgi:hypothetical protein